MHKFVFIWQFKPVRTVAFFVTMFLIALVISILLNWAQAYADDGCLTDYECECLYSNGVN